MIGEFRDFDLEVSVVNAYRKAVVVVLLLKLLRHSVTLQPRSWSTVATPMLQTFPKRLRDPDVLATTIDL
jgi:hypothetical protein